MTVSNVAEEPATMRFIHSRSDPFSNPPTWSGHYALLTSRAVVFALFIVSLHCISYYLLSFSLPPSSLSLTFSLSSLTSLADFEFIAPKRQLGQLGVMYYSFVHYAPISLRGMRADRMYACMRAYATKHTSPRRSIFNLEFIIF